MNAASPPAPLLAFEGVRFGYAPGKPVLEDFSWQVFPGEFWAILGPSGSGKTTLLYLLAGLRRPEAGRVTLAGQEVRGPSERVGLLLQDYGLLPWYSAARNLEVALAIRGLPRRARRAQSRDWLGRLGLLEHAGRYPAQLSGGQRQRVALARLLALGPEVLLLDEPLSALDELTRERLQRELFALSRAGGRTTLLVTHNIEEAALLADRVLLVDPESVSQGSTRQGSGKQGPIKRGAVLESPFGGLLPERSDPRFAAFCSLLRERMGL